MGPRIVIIGAGPAGVRATALLARAGLQPLLIDEAVRVGGQVYRQEPGGGGRPPAEVYGSEASKATAIHTCLDSVRGQFEYRPRTLVWNVFKNQLDVTSEGRHEKVELDRLLIATGAFDRVIPFPGWTLPGTFTLGGAQIALKAQRVAIGQRVAFVGAGPLLPLVASQYLKAGADVAAVIDVTPFSAKVHALARMLTLPGMVLRGLSYLRAIRRHRVPIVYDARAIRVEGSDRVQAISWATRGGKRTTVACDAVGASFGLRSETQLAELAGCRFSYDTTIRQWLPERTAAGRTSLDRVYLAGDCAGIGGADVAELAGERAAWAMQEDMGLQIDAARIAFIDKQLRRQQRFRAGLEAAYPFPHHLFESLDDETLICRCEGIAVGQLRAWHAKAHAPEVNRQKALSRAGLGRCQGRVCGLAAAELLARLGGQPIESVGRLRSQPPIKPITIRG